MRRIVIFLFALAMVLGFCVQAQATLVDRGADNLGYHLIYDTDLDLTWYDYTKSGNTWQNQVNWADGLTVNFGGNTYDNWRLPATVDGQFVFGYDGTTGGYNITNSEMGHLYYTELGNEGTFPQPGWGITNMGPFNNLLAYYYWSGTEYSLDPGYAWYFLFDRGYQGISSKGTDFLFALAVRPGDVPVPEPATMLLFASGLAGLGTYRWKTGRRRW